MATPDARKRRARARRHRRARARGSLHRRAGAALLACAVLALACGGTDKPPRVRQGSADAPTYIHIVLPSPDVASLRELARSRDTWEKLESEALALSQPERYPQPTLTPAFVSAATRAAEDLLDPIVGIEPLFGLTRNDPEAVASLIVVEMLPDSTIQRLHGSDAFTESAHDLDQRFIRRSVIRLPGWLLDRPPDDFANFFEHELGHALGYEGHIDEMWAHGENDTWFWDRLMTVPIRPGQIWQPATSEDIFAIVDGRYRLRDGWIAGRVPRFEEAAPYRRVPLGP